MEFEIKKLVLYEPLNYSTKEQNSEEKMTRFTTKVNYKTMEPIKEDYLTNPEFCGYAAEQNAENEIPVGTYAFVQWIDKPEINMQDVAEALWLDCVWKEYKVTDNTVYLRELPHGQYKVFQLFREIITPES